LPNPVWLEASCDTAEIGCGRDGKIKVQVVLVAGGATEFPCLGDRLGLLAWKESKARKKWLCGNKGGPAKKKQRPAKGQAHEGLGACVRQFDEPAEEMIVVDKDPVAHHLVFCLRIICSYPGNPGSD
jgi:hypothetical protein